MLEQMARNDGIVANTMKELQLVNKHWCSWATGAIETLRPPNVPMRTLLMMVADKFVNLRFLKIGNIKKVADEDLVNIGKLQTLTYLSFTPYGSDYVREITDMGVSSLGSLNASKDLYLSHCDKITDVGVQHLGALTSLTRLSLGFCFGISDEGARYLESMMPLRDLSLEYCQKFTDAGVRHLGALRALTKLCLGDCPEIADKGARHLGGFLTLRNPDLRNCWKIADVEVRHLGALTSLTKLSLCNLFSYLRRECKVLGM